MIKKFKLYRFKNVKTAMIKLKKSVVKSVSFVGAKKQEKRKSGNSIFKAIESTPKNLKPKTEPSVPHETTSPSLNIDDFIKKHNVNVAKLYLNRNKNQKRYPNLEIARGVSAKNSRQYFRRSTSSSKRSSFRNSFRRKFSPLLIENSRKHSSKNKNKNNCFQNSRDSEPKIFSFDDPNNTYISFDESVSDLDLPVKNQETLSLEDLIEMEREYIDLNEDSFCSNDFSDEELYSRAVKETDDDLERLKSELLELKL